MRLKAGTSGWAFKEWKGNFYPRDLKQDGWLGFYASRFPTVEINNTFYRMPRENVLADWAAQVPEHFSFALKASQGITHYSRIMPTCAPAVDLLLRTTAALGRRLGPILFQLPPNLKKDVVRLRGFLGLLPPDRRFTIEFRNEEWFDEDVYAALREHDIPMCIGEQEGFTTPKVATASWGYLRPHRFDYDTDSLGTWARYIAGQAWTDAYVFFKHDEGVGSGPPAVDAFVTACADAGIGVTT